MAKEILEYKSIKEYTENCESKDTIKIKPYFGLVIGILSGVATFLIPYLVFKIIGFIIILICLYILFFVKDRKLIAFYDNYLIVFNENKQDEGIYIPYARIKEYDCKRSSYGTQAIILILNNDDYVYCETYKIYNLVRIFERYLRGKRFKKAKRNNYGN